MQSATIQARIVSVDAFRKLYPSPTHKELADKASAFLLICDRDAPFLALALSAADCALMSTTTATAQRVDTIAIVSALMEALFKRLAPDASPETARSALAAVDKALASLRLSIVETASRTQPTRV